MELSLCILPLKQLWVLEVCLLVAKTIPGIRGYHQFEPSTNYNETYILWWWWPWARISPSQEENSFK